MRRRIQEQGGADARDLEAITTDPGLGAPAAAAAPDARGRGRDGRKPYAPDTAPPAGDRAPLPAAVDATLDGGSSSTLLLLLGGLVAAAVVAGAAVARRRSSAS